MAPKEVLDQLVANGQVATQYVDLEGNPSMDIDANPNGSMMAIEGIFSPDGRVFGKMGHLERRGPFVGVNVPGERHQPCSSPARSILNNKTPVWRAAGGRAPGSPSCIVFSRKDSCLSEFWGVW